MCYTLCIKQHEWTTRWKWNFNVIGFCILEKNTARWPLLLNKRKFFRRLFSISKRKDKGIIFFRVNIKKEFELYTLPCPASPVLWGQTPLSVYGEGRPAHSRWSPRSLTVTLTLPCPLRSNSTSCLWWRSASKFALVPQLKYTRAPQTVHNTPVMNILKGYFYIILF